MNFTKRHRITDGEIILELTGKHVDPDPNGWGTSYIYDIEANGKIVGRCDLRLGESSTLDLAGHIGYAVYLPYRGHHYAAKSCVLLFNEAKRFGMKRLLITCNTDNLASYRTCELSGCVFLRTEIVPKDHELYLQGDREKAIFIKTL